MAFEKSTLPSIFYNLLYFSSIKRKINRFLAIACILQAAMITIVLLCYDYSLIVHITALK